MYLSNYEEKLKTAEMGNIKLIMTPATRSLFVVREKGPPAGVLHLTIFERKVKIANFR
jgi:hypothetical protein